VIPEIDSDAVRFDIVWLKAWGQAASEGTAEELTPENDDPRLRVWWDDEAVTGTGLGDYLTGNTPLYDVFVLQPPEELWNRDNWTPGDPDEVWRNGISADRAEEMVEEIEERIPDCSVILPVEDRPEDE